VTINLRTGCASFPDELPSILMTDQDWERGAVLHAILVLVKRLAKEIVSMIAGILQAEARDRLVAPTCATRGLTLHSSPGIQP